MWCALLVVSIHCGFGSFDNGLGWWIHQVFSSGYSAIAVPFFFVASGFFLAAHINEKRWWKTEVVKRARSLAIPFFCWAILYQGVDSFFAFVHGGVSDNYDYNFMFIGRQIYHGNVNVLLPHSWYPWALLYFGMVFIFSYKIRAKLNRLIAVWIGLVSYYILTRYILHYGVWWYVSTWAFAIGCSYAEYENRITDIIKKLKWKYPLMLMLIYITFRFGIEKLILFKGVPLVSEISHVMLGIVIVTTLYFYPLPRWKWLMFLGTISYEYYLCHGEVHFVMSKLSITDPRLITILTLLVSIPIAWLVHLVWITIHRKIIASKI